MQKKQRLDVRLVESGLLPSRQAAQAAIMDGGILVDGEKITKAGTMVSGEAKIELTKGWQGQKYVSRGGLKLEKALNTFAVDPQGRICLDIGASTGGFTDCLLQFKAKKVYAIDVGYGEIAWSLRQNPQVVVKERLNARNLTADLVYGQDHVLADLACVDVSFISLAKILAPLHNVLAPGSDIICLIKPQFEAGKGKVGKGGVVRAPDEHREIVQTLIQNAKEMGLNAAHLTFSPVKGPAGNIEFLVHFVERQIDQAPSVEAVVGEAHEKLG